MIDNIKDIISNAVHSKRDDYSKLNNDERIVLVSQLLSESDHALFYADQESTLQKAIARSIYFKGSDESLRELYKEITKLFLTGEKNLDAYFSEIINELLHEEWINQNTEPNEHFVNDAMNRAKDIQSELNTIKFY